MKLSEFKMGKYRGDDYSEIIIKGDADDEFKDLFLSKINKILNLTNEEIIINKDGFEINDVHNRIIFIKTDKYDNNNYLGFMTTGIIILGISLYNLNQLNKFIKEMYEIKGVEDE